MQVKDNEVLELIQKIKGGKALSVDCFSGYVCKHKITKSTPQLGLEGTTYCLISRRKVRLKRHLARMSIRIDS